MVSQFQLHRISCYYCWINRALHPTTISSQKGARHAFRGNTIVSEDGRTHKPRLSETEQRT